MTPFSIIPAPSDGFPVVLKLLRIAAIRLQEKGLTQWDYWLDPPAERLNWAKEGFDKNQFYFLQSQSKIIGMYRLMTTDELYWGKMNEQAYYIHSLVIIPKYSSQGLGAQIISRVYQKATENKIPFLRLDCNASNTALCNYYENLGFQKAGTKLMPHSLNNLYELKVTAGSL